MQFNNSGNFRLRCAAAALKPHRCRCAISPRGCFTSSIDCSAQVNGIAGGCPRNTAPTLLHVTLPQLSSRPRRGRVAACADGGDWRVSCSVALTRHPVPRSPARVYRACCNSAARPDAHKPHTSQPPLLPYGGLRCCRAAYWPTIKSQLVQPPPLHPPPTPNRLSPPPVGSCSGWHSWHIPSSSSLAQAKAEPGQCVMLQPILQQLNDPCVPSSGQCATAAITPYAEGIAAAGASEYACAAASRSECRRP